MTHPLSGRKQSSEHIAKRTAALQVDHIKPWSTHQALRYEVSNGQVLCKPCHAKTPTYGIKALRFKEVEMTA